VELGISESIILKCSEEPLRTLTAEPDEECILVKTIKTYSKEKKASHSYSTNVVTLDDKNSTPYRRASSS
jgi:hypothetical protein